MPHFGLIDDRLHPADAALLRARLHMRGGRIRLLDGRNEDGVAALYDAMVNAMLRFFDSSELRQNLTIGEDDDLNDDRTLFVILKKSGVLDSTVDVLDFDYLRKKMDEAIEDELVEFNAHRFMHLFNRIMALLDVIPFDESDLPEADSVTL
ncbi:MAG: hypothetical protein ACFFE2_11435 [Candidatus Thorarchaeota archaeon]